MLCLIKENLWLDWSLAYLRKWFWQFSQIINLNNLWLPWSHFWGERPAKNSIFTILIIFLMPHQWIFMTDAIVIHNWSLNFVVSFFWEWERERVNVLFKKKMNQKWHCRWHCGTSFCILKIRIEYLDFTSWNALNNHRLCLFQSSSSAILIPTLKVENLDFFWILCLLRCL